MKEVFSMKKKITVEFISDDALNIETRLRGIILTLLQHDGCKQIKVVSESGE